MITKIKLKKSFFYFRTMEFTNYVSFFFWTDIKIDTNSASFTSAIDTVAKQIAAESKTIVKDEFQKKTLTDQQTSTKLYEVTVDDLNNITYSIEKGEKAYNTQYLVRNFFEKCFSS